MKNRFKRMKFKDDCLSWKKHNQIIFEDKGLKKHGDMMFPSSKWHLKREKRKVAPHIHPDAPVRKEMTSHYYKGKIVNKKYEGLGTEIILERGNYLDDVVSFYKGQWKKGKKNGKGFWSNHHPLIGRTYDIDAMNPYYTIFEDDAYFYDGNWKDDKKHGKGYLENEEGTFSGEFKNDKKWKGVFETHERIHQNVGSDRYYTDKKDHVYKTYKHIIKIEKGKEVSRKSKLISEDFFKAKPNPYKKNKS